MECAIEGCHRLRSETGYEGVDAFNFVGSDHTKEPEDSVFQLDTVRAGEMFHCFRNVVDDGRVVGANGKDESAKLQQVFALQVDDGAGIVVLDDIENGAGIKPDSVFAGQENLAWINHSGSEASAMDCAESVSNLNHVAPESLFCDMGWRLIPRSAISRSSEMNFGERPR